MYKHFTSHRFMRPVVWWMTRWAGVSSLPVCGLLCCAAMNAAETNRDAELYRAGKLALQDRLFTVAEGHFRQLLQISPNSPHAPEAYLLLGETLYFQDRWAESAETLENGQRKFPPRFPDSFLFWLGQAYSGSGRYTDALPFYRQLIEKFPSSRYRPQALFNMGDNFSRTGQWEEAEKTFQTLLHDASSAEYAAEATIGLGKLYLVRNDAITAQKQFQEVIEKYPRSQAIWLAHYWLAECSQHQSQWDQALAELKIIADATQKVYPNALRAEAWYAMGRIHLGQGDFETAAKDFSQAKNLTRSLQLQTASLLQQAEALFCAKRVDDAILQLRDFVQVHATEPPTVYVLLRIAEMLYSQRQWDNSRQAYRDIIEKFPQSELVGNAHFGAGWCLLEMGRASEAMDEFSLVAQHGSSAELKAQAQCKIADIYLSQNQLERAVQNYQQIVDHFGTTSTADRAQFQIGIVQSRARNFTAAVAAFEALVKKSPAGPYADRAQFQMGATRYNLGQFPEARKAYEILLQNFPQSSLRAEAWLAIAHVWQAEGRYAEALTQYDDFDKHFANDPLQPRALFEHADAVARMHDLPRARTEFSKFLAKYPNHPLSANAQFWLAQDLFAQKDFLKAQEAFAQVPQKFPDSELAPEALFWAGRCAMSRQNYQEARDVLEGLTKKYPQNPRCADARFFQADSLTEEGKFGEAVVLFDEVIRSYPDSVLVDAAWGRKGNCLFILGKDDPKRYQEAITAYQQVLLREKAGLELRNQAEFDIGRCYEELPKPDEAFEHYMHAVYQTVASEVTTRETFWFAKASDAAARIKEKQKRWGDAVRVWERLAAAQMPVVSAEAKKRADQIRKEHPEEF